MLNQVTIFTVHRHEETRTHQIVHHLDFLLAGVAGNVDAVALFINNVRTQLVQMVDSTGTSFSLPGIGVAEIMAVSPGIISTFYGHS